MLIYFEFDILLLITFILKNYLLGENCPFISM